MTIIVTNHLNFRGNARAALEFYQFIFGGKLVMITYQDAHNVQNPLEADQIMWGQVTAQNGFQIMAYDVPSHTPWNPGENAFFISIRANTDVEISEVWEKLSHEGVILHPLSPAVWSPLYGMLKDRFGITWVLDVAAN